MTELSGNLENVHILVGKVASGRANLTSEFPGGGAVTVNKEEIPFGIGGNTTRISNSPHCHAKRLSYPSMTDGQHVPCNPVIAMIPILFPDPIPQTRRNIISEVRKRRALAKSGGADLLVITKLSAPNASSPLAGANTITAQRKSDRPLYRQ